MGEEAPERITAGCEARRVLEPAMNSYQLKPSEPEPLAARYIVEVR